MWEADLRPSVCHFLGCNIKTFWNNEKRIFGHFISFEIILPKTNIFLENKIPNILHIWTTYLELLSQVYRYLKSKSEYIVKNNICESSYYQKCISGNIINNFHIAFKCF